MPMELAGFAVTSAIAVVTAFGAHYGSSLPNVITWSDWLAAFMLGFGLDQLRDTVAPTTTSAPAVVTPATSSRGIPSGALIPAGGRPHGAQAPAR